MTIAPSLFKVLQWWIFVTVVTTVGVWGAVGGVAVAAQGLHVDLPFESLTWPCVIASAVIVVMTTTVAGALLGRNGASLILDEQGFVFQTRFRKRSHGWSDIRHFVVGGSPFMPCVMLTYAAEYRAKIGARPRRHAAGNDEMLPPYFAPTPDELAQLLNDFRDRSQGPKEVPAADVKAEETV